MKTIAIVGLGAAAREIHLPAYAQISALKVVGGYDPAVTGTNFGFPLFSSADEMLEKVRPDILTVATPPESHFEWTRRGLLAGCHVFCEKPFMTTMEEAHEICELSRQKQYWVVVNNQYRFMNIHSMAKQEIGSPKFGQLLFLQAQQTFLTSEVTERGWRGQDQERTCKEFGTHVFDLCRFFFNEDPLAIRARMPKNGRPDSPDYLNLIELEFSQDRMAQITLDRLSRGPHRYLELRLDGTAGCLETHLGGGVEFKVGIRGGLRRPYLNADVSMGGWARLYHGERFRKIATDPLNIFSRATSRLLQEFLAAIETGTAPPCHADDNRRTLALMLAAYESHRQKKTIEIAY